MQLKRRTNRVSFRIGFSATNHSWKLAGDWRSEAVAALCWLLLASMGGATTGCTLNRQGHREIADVLAEYERRHSATVSEYAGVPHAVPATTSAPAGRTFQPLIEDTTLAGLIATALERNPDILGSIDTARSIASRIPQATALMDPMLMTKTLPEPTRTADGDMVFVLSVQQVFPIPQKLDHRGRVALAETRMAVEKLEQTRLRVVADVKRSYFGLFAIDQAIGITKENQTLLRDLIEVARGQMIAGRRQQEDVLRAQVELSNLESQLVELHQRRVTTVALINSILDRPPSTEVPPLGEYDIRRLDPRLNELLAQSYRRNPELRELERQIERDQQSLDLAKLEYWPDFTVGFEWMAMNPRTPFIPPVNPDTGMRPPYSRMSEEGTDSWAIMAGVNLPIWFERIEGGIREARERLSASRRQLHSAKNRITYQVEDALARIRSQRDIAGLFSTAIIPQAEQAYQVSRQGYITGTSDFQFVIDNWQKRLFFRLQYYRTLGDLERSVADLEQTVGVTVLEAQVARNARPNGG
ncbi:MAG: TolC family protein [Phycisphaerae bacterium]|nr:TolC family protein [Phycisphaerae bacterium]